MIGNDSRDSLGLDLGLCGQLSECMRYLLFSSSLVRGDKRIRFLFPVKFFELRLFILCFCLLYTYLGTLILSCNQELNKYTYLGIQQEKADKMAGVTQPPYPLHPSIASRVHPEYAAFYNEYIITQQQVHLQPVAASRTSGILIPGGGPVLPVGKTEDIAIKRVETDGPDVLVRVFTPEEPAPEGGYGVMLYMHGGGWVLGNINTENTVCTNICKRAGVVVVTVDYRFVSPSPFTSYVCHCLIPRRIDWPPKTPSQPPCTTAGKPSSGFTHPQQYPI